jgi:hypothetical protein
VQTNLPGLPDFHSHLGVLAGGRHKSLEVTNSWPPLGTDSSTLIVGMKTKEISE